MNTCVSASACPIVRLRLTNLSQPWKTFLVRNCPIFWYCASFDEHLHFYQLFQQYVPARIFHCYTKETNFPLVARSIFGDFLGRLILIQAAYNLSWGGGLGCVVSHLTLAICWPFQKTLCRRAILHNPIFCLL